MGRATRTPLGLMADRTVGPFMVGKVLSACGTWIQQLAAVVLMYQLTRSALLVGAVSAVQFASPLVLSLWTGALSDRVDRRRQLLVGRLITGLACLVLAVLLMVRGVDHFGGQAVLLASVAVMGFGSAVGAPAMQALVHDLVPARDLEAVLALNSVSPSLARTIGPAAGAGLLVLGGPGLAFLATAVVDLIFVVVLAVIRARPHDPPDRRPSLFGGFAYLAGDRATALLLIGVVVVCYGGDPVLTLAPKLADNLNDSHLVGVFVSAFGAGAVLLTILFPQLRRVLSLRASTVAGFWALGAGLLITGALQTRWGALVGFCVAGFGFMLATVCLNTRIQRQIPDHVRGRVMALWSVAFLGARPLSAPINGAIADLTGVGTALLVTAVVVVAASLLARVREHEHPPAQPA
jgi:MFS family permease